MSEGKVPRELMDEVMRLGPDERRALAEALRAMIAEEMASREEGVPERCPRCGCEHVIKKGRDSAGRQRYQCKECKSTFSGRAVTILSRSKLDASTWVTYAEGMADGLTLRELAERCRVCLKTSWFMRMRLMEAMGHHLDAFRSGPDVSVEVDGTMLHESLCGNNGKGSFRMPREPHKSGGSLHVRGVSGQLACVVCAGNDRGDVLAVLMGRAHGTSEEIREALEGVLEEGTHVATDDLAQYVSVLRELGCEHEVRPSKPRPGERSLGIVNSIHERLKSWLRRFHGVSTRRLQRYLHYFCFLQQFSWAVADRREVVTREAMTGTYDTTIRQLFAEPRFDMGYWEGRAA